ncbi:growth hormone receptor b isoform X1 [Osmerus mordax]|uniref:growth hormone receptor b isoform X1 n=3 Tax=Osmerus mordax TaxID=8014 RepID=UPI0035106A60
MFLPETRAMAALLTVLFCLLKVLTSAAEQQSHSHQGKDLTKIRPNFKACISRNMETFHCKWNVGTIQNLSELGDLRMVYMKKNASPKVWSECPDYSSDTRDECYFSEEHTSVWIPYILRLCSRDPEDFYDELIFSVEDIVHPDPPVGLNWTLLNVGLTGTHFDALVRWVPPASADVLMGWMKLQYELQHREVNASLWKAGGLDKETQISLFGLKTNVDYEIRVRCKMQASRNFGEFSDSISIRVPAEESRFPIAILLVFASLFLVAILMLVIVSQQQKLMIVFLPPVPGPKIRGIDPELLKKGKLAELTSILGGHPDLRPELYSDDPWVEFIELDIEDPNDRITNLDTECLVDRSPPSDCQPLSIGFRDDDSGRASCCDPDLPDQDASSFHPPPSNTNPSLEHPDPATTEHSSPSLVPATSWFSWAVPGREDLYAQVSEVRPSGEVVLAPEEQRQAEETPEKDLEVKDEKEEQKKKKARKEFQLLMVNPDRHGYTSELDAGKLSSKESESSEAPVREEYSFLQSPYLEAEIPPVLPATPTSPAPSPSVYTRVEGVDTQNSLILQPRPLAASQPIQTKPMPTPEGYLTPELLGNITP